MWFLKNIYCKLWEKTNDREWLSFDTMTTTRGREGEDDEGDDMDEEDYAVTSQVVEEEVEEDGDLQEEERRSPTRFKDSQWHVDLKDGVF